jgi:hypothetical protein
LDRIADVSPSQPVSDLGGRHPGCGRRPEIAATGISGFGRPAPVEVTLTRLGWSPISGSACSWGPLFAVRGRVEALVGFAELGFELGDAAIERHVRVMSVSQAAMNVTETLANSRRNTIAGRELKPIKRTVKWGYPT